MPKRYISPALEGFRDTSPHIAPLSGVEAAMYDQIWRSIVEGALKPGTKLREDIICSVFGISRTPVRKVLVILEQEGMVSLPQNHGVFVATPTPEDAKDVCHAIEAVVVYVIERLSSPSFELTSHDKQLVERHIAAQIEAEEKEDFARSRLLSGEFMILLSLIYGNEVLSELVTKLTARMTMVATLYQAHLYHPRRAELQRSLFQQIAKHEQEAAVATARRAFAAFFGTLRFESGSDEPDLRAILQSGNQALESSSDERPNRRRQPRKKAES